MPACCCASSRRQNWLRVAPGQPSGAGRACQGTVGMTVSALGPAMRQLLSLLQLSVGSVGLQLVSKVVLSRASGQDLGAAPPTVPVSSSDLQ